CLPKTAWPPTCHSLYLPESETMTRRQVNMEPKLRPAFPPKIRTY
ncbi:hypothetical protein, partial [Enterobacter kobei]